MTTRFRIPALLLALAGLPTLHGSPDHPVEWRSQFRQLEEQMKDRSWCARVEGQTAHPAALITPGDRDPLDVVLRRSGTLLDHLAKRPDPPDLDREQLQRRDLAARAAAIEI